VAYSLFKNICFSLLPPALGEAQGAGI